MTKSRRRLLHSRRPFNRARTRVAPAALNRRIPLSTSRKRKIALLVILALLLALLAGYYFYYRDTHKLSLDIAPVDSAAVQPPQYLFSFAGPGGDRMQRPVGVLADENEVFVVDSARRRVGVYSPDGDQVRSFGASDTVVPLYVAKNPVDGNLYVTDRRARTVHVFEPSGAYQGEFDPKLPKDQLPTFDTKGVQWAPVAIAFASDGTMYVTDILKGHRLLVFGPDGSFVKSVGTVGLVADAEQSPNLFQFPNGIVVHKDLVYVADSNNRRVQVFDKDGNFKSIVVTEGLPRGISFLGPFPGDDAETPGRFVVIDTLAHDGTLWTDKGEKILTFGEQGVMEGQFSYPTAASVGPRNKIYIADTANGRVQVWGWPEQVSPVPIPKLPQKWGYCLLPLLLLPLLLLLRRKKFFTTADFVFAMVDNEDAELMPGRRRKWFVTAADYQRLKEIKQGEVDMSTLLHEMEYSESDVRALKEKLEISQEQAIVLSLAQRARVFTTQDEALRRLAKTIELDVVNRVEFIERFSKKAQPQSGEPTE